MLLPLLQNVEFWAVNTDKQALDSNICPNKLQIGIELTRGLGTGGKPTLGEQAAQESVEDLSKVVAGADMLFITAGEGQRVSMLRAAAADAWLHVGPPLMQAQSPSCALICSASAYDNTLVILASSSSAAGLLQQ